MALKHWEKLRTDNENDSMVDDQVDISFLATLYTDD